MNRKVENVLADYYQNVNKVNRLMKELKRVRQRMEEIELRIRNTEVFIGLESKSITFEERVQSSSTGESYQEKELQKAISKLEKEYKSNLVEEIVLERDIRILEKDTWIIEDQLQLLPDDEKLFIELKYRDDFSNEYIAKKLAVSTSTLYRIKGNVINKFVEVLM